MTHEKAHVMKTQELHIRDPFVLPVAEEKAYYLYGTTAPHAIDGPWTHFEAYRSADLENWEGPFTVWRKTPDFWGDKHFWAPEVYRYRGRYCMFAGFKKQDRPRGVGVLRAASPRGPFEPVVNGPVTPRQWNTLDGTLFVDDDAQPWMVFCHEWVEVHDGEMAAVPLSEDLSRMAGEPVKLFSASQAPWVKEFICPTVRGFVTDGPFLWRSGSGKLYMLWASYGGDGHTYFQGIARSLSGKVSGPWVQQAHPLYDKDGGHGMIFRTFDLRAMLTVHTPNDFGREHPIFVPVREEGDRLVAG